jgi:hypothetical protein
LLEIPNGLIFYFPEILFAAIAVIASPAMAVALALDGHFLQGIALIVASVSAAHWFVQFHRHGKSFAAEIILLAFLAVLLGLYHTLPAGYRFFK